MSPWIYFRVKKMFDKSTRQMDAETSSAWHFWQKLTTTTCHPEFISGSRRILTNLQDKWMLKQVQHDIFDKKTNYYNLSPWIYFRVKKIFDKSTRQIDAETSSAWHFWQKLITTTCPPEFISGSRRFLTNIQDKWMLKQVRRDIFDKN